MKARSFLIRLDLEFQELHGFKSNLLNWQDPLQPNDGSSTELQN